MAVVSGSWLVDFLLLVIPVLYFVYHYTCSISNYFEKHGVPYLKPTGFLGIYNNMFSKPSMELAQTFYNSFPGERFFGYFHTGVPTLLVKDIDLVHRIMVKDFAYFQDRGFPFFETDILARNLFNLTGQTWKSLRMKVSSTFTSGKMKEMFEQFDKSGDHLLENIKENQITGVPVDAKLITANFSSEVIASTAFGLDFGKDKPQTSQFILMTSSCFISGLRAVLTGTLFTFAPKLAYMLGLGFYTSESTEYFLNLTKATKEYRLKKNLRRNDYFQLLLDLQEAEKSGKDVIPLDTDKNEEDNLINQMEHVPQSSPIIKGSKMFTDEGITGQTVVFLLGGLDTVSTTLIFSLYHIAKDPAVQSILTEEVLSVITKHGALTYQAVKEMTYMDQVLQETMRLHPTLPYNLRKCSQSYTIPESDFVIEKGTVINIPVAGLHLDPKHHPNPEVFKPERFVGNNYKPNPTYLPFGDGPRICIGLRFAIVEMKVCLAKILSQYSIEVNKKTQEPLVLDKKSFVPKPVGGIWVNFKNRN